MKTDLSQFSFLFSHLMVHTERFTLKRKKKKKNTDEFSPLFCAGFCISGCSFDAAEVCLKSDERLVRKVCLSVDCIICRPAHAHSLLLYVFEMYVKLK